MLGEQLERPADVVRWLGAVQAQDYGQSLWAVGSRLRRGTIATVERAIADREIVRTWLMRGTIHFAAPEDVRWLLKLCAPRLAVAEERRRTQLDITSGELDRSRDLLGSVLAGGCPLSRPDVFRLLEDAGIATTGQRGYHIVARLAREGLICFGPMQGKQPTFVLLDDWAPRAEARELTHAEALAELAGRFVASRGPVTDHDLARWAGITLGDAREGLLNAPELATRELDGATYWLAAGQADARAPRAGRGRGFCSPDSTSSCWATRIAPLSSTPRTRTGSCPGPTASSSRWSWWAGRSWARGRAASVPGPSRSSSIPSCSAPGSSHRWCRRTQSATAGSSDCRPARRSRSRRACAPRSSCSRATCASTTTRRWPPRLRASSRVVPLFVFDREVLARFGAPNRVAFLLDALGDLDASLRARGGALVLREGDVVGRDDARRPAMRVPTRSS